MTSKILINAVDSEECRIAKVKDSKLEDFQIENAAREILHGNIYKGIVTRVEPSLQAAFVDFGAERHGFLQKSEIHSDYYQAPPSGSNAIGKIINRGQELLVQVTKDPIMKKGAMLTTMISIPGRHVVLMPGNKRSGISRKIEDEAERKRLKTILGTIKLPDGFGVIVRTAGLGCKKTHLMKDIRYLLRLWKSIKSQGIKKGAPCLLYKERNLAIRAIRDNLSPEISEILIDDETVFKEVKTFVHIISPKHNKIVKLHKSGKPIFTKFQLEDQIASIFKNRVSLKSGGSIVIEQTEALVSVDVNSGKGTRKKNIEETAHMTNLEAAEEIARQLMLRDLGGLIVIDFIDMRDRKHKTQVERMLRTHMKSDKARSRVGNISRFGLLEMSRQRLRPSIEFSSYRQCPYCDGRGVTPSVETLGLALLRKLNVVALKEGMENINVMLPSTVADYILNRKRKEIFELETRRNIAITVTGDDNLKPGQTDISFSE